MDWHVNGSSKTIKLLKGKISINLHDFGLSNGFLNMRIKPQAKRDRYIGFYKN